MAKSNGKLTDNAQPRLFVLPMPSTLSLRLAASIKEALRGKSRDLIADAMSLELGRQISRTQLDAWAAPSKPEHRIPADALVALCRAARSNRPLEMMAGELETVLVATSAEKAWLAYGRNQALKRRLLREEQEIEAALDRLDEKK